LILTAAFPDLLPSTIRSRCRMIRFQPLSEGAVAQILMRDRGIGQEEAARLARYSQGSLSGVMEAELEDLVSRRDRFLEGMQAWEESDIVSVLEFAGRFTGSTGEAMDFVELLLEWTRDLIAIKLKGPAGVLMYQDRIEQLLEKSRCMSLSDLLVRFDDLRATHQRLGRNVNARLALEVALGRMAK
jgi:DNA polymerase-3 subunit delta'